MEIEVAQQVRQMMITVVEKGSGQEAPLFPHQRLQ